MYSFRPTPTTMVRLDETAACRLVLALTSEGNLQPCDDLSADLDLGGTNFTREMMRHPSTPSPSEVLCDDEWLLSSTGPTLVRVGPLVFVDREMFLTPTAERLRSPSALTFPIDKMRERAPTVQLLGDFTCPTLLCVASTPLAGHRVVDCGCGDGALSLVAAALKARECVLVDSAFVSLSQAVTNWNLNNFSRELLTTYEQDLADPAFDATLASADTVLCNLGNFYDVTNRDIIDRMAPTTVNFIGGGYFAPSDGSTSPTFASLIADAEHLRGLGFDQQTLCTLRVRDGIVASLAATRRV